MASLILVKCASKLLIMFCPADSREQYFEGLAELMKNGREPSREELLGIDAKV